MAFPTRRSESSGLQASNNVSWVITLPPTINAGDALVVLLGIDEIPVVTWDNTSHGTWTSKEDVNGSANKGVIQVKVADGTEAAGTLTITMDSEQAGTWRCWAIQDWDGTLAGIESAGQDNGNSADPETPALNPTGWGIEDTLWMKFCVGNNGGFAVTGWPLADNQSTSNGGGGGGVSDGICSGDSAVADIGTGAFTRSQTPNVGFTVAIRPAAAASLFEVIVDPDNGPGTDHTSLQAWMDSINGLHSSGDTVRAICRRTGTTDDDWLRVNNLVAGLIVEIQSDPAFPMYRIDNTNMFRNCIRVFNGISVTIDDIRMKNTVATQAGVQVDAGTVVMNRCIVNEANGAGFKAGGSTADLTLNNCISFGNSVTVSTDSAYICQSSAVLVCNYCIAAAGTHGFNHDSGTMTVNNCYSGGNSINDYDGTITKNKAASSDTTGEAGLQSIPYSLANFTNVTVGSEDFHLVTGSALIEAALVISLTTDFDGVARDGSTPDIGPFEFVAAGGGGAVLPTPSATGTMVLTQQVTLSKSFPIVVTGSPAFARQVSYLRSFSFAPSIVVSQTKQVGLPRGVSASGAMASQQAVGVRQQAGTFTGTGSVSSSSDTILGQVRVYAASASSALGKHIAKGFNFVGTGIQTLIGDGIEPSTGRGILRLMIRTMLRDIPRDK